MAKQNYLPSGAKIKVIGMGGGGCNAITRMVREGIRGVEFIAMNTDSQHLAITEAAVRLQIGERITRGLGAGGDNHMGQKAAEESRDEIKAIVAGADMIFLTCGMGGGTGTGTIPFVAQACKQSGALTIAIVTRPFGFEGNHRSRTAEEGINDLLKSVDTLVIIPNDRLLQMCDQKASVDSAFKMADEVLCHGVQAIAEVVTVPGLINLDFADVRTVMKDAGPAWMSIGRGSGTNRARDAARQALASPLLDVSLEGAKGVLFNVAGDESLTLFEVNDAAQVIQQAVDPVANIIFGVVVDPNMGKDVRLTLIATGFAGKEGMINKANDKEINRILKSQTDEDLELPSFMRYKNSYAGQHRRPVFTDTQRRN